MAHIDGYEWDGDGECCGVVVRTKEDRCTCWCDCDECYEARSVERWVNGEEGDFTGADV